MADSSPPPPSSKRLRHDAQDDRCHAPLAVADASAACPPSSKRFRHDAQELDCLPLQKRCGFPLSPAVSSHLSFLEFLCELESTPPDEAASLPFSSESTCSQELLLAEMMQSFEKVIGDGGADVKDFANETLQRLTDRSSGLANGEDSEVQARIRHLLEASDDELGIVGSSFSGDDVRQVSEGESAPVGSSSPLNSGGEEDWSAFEDDEVQQVYNVGAWWLDEAVEQAQNSGTHASGCLVMLDLQIPIDCLQGCDLNMLM